MRSRLLVAAIAAAAAFLVAVAPASAALPRILIYRFGDKPPKALYKPKTLTASGHYAISNARWTQWGPSRAVGTGDVTSGFGGAPTKHQSNVTISFSTPRRACGVLTYTVARINGGLVAKMADQDGFCSFIVQ